jgi:hypothetical protein
MSITNAPKEAYVNKFSSLAIADDRACGYAGRAAHGASKAHHRAIIGRFLPIFCSSHIQQTRCAGEQIDIFPRRRVTINQRFTLCLRRLLIFSLLPAIIRNKRSAFLFYRQTDGQNQYVSNTT